MPKFPLSVAGRVTKGLQGVLNMGRRFFAVVVVMLLGIALAPIAGADEPLDTWETLVGFDCVGDRFNPVRPDGTKDPNGDPAPGSPEWIERDNERLQCDSQRDHDRRTQPVAHVTSARYGEDWYRQPYLYDDVRFRFDYFPVGTGPGEVPAMEVYRPCSNEPGSCPGLPAGLERFDAPYPVVVIHHGFIATMTHHRFNAQVFAEAGYLAITVNGTHPVPGAPNVQRNVNAGLVLDWLASEESGDVGQEADLDRVALAGHSQGSAAALSYQGDPRVHAIVAWDGGDSIAEGNTSQPIMYQRTDGAFSAPQATARTDYPATRDRGLQTYVDHKDRGLDVFHLNLRATNHIDWNGNGVGSLAGNRLAELVINYYSLAWLDRHLQGRLVLDDAGNVVPSGGRTEAEERAYRQAQAQDAFDRLTAMRFDDSVDIHNISMGWYDPVQHATSVNPLYGGNVPYSIDGLWITDRLSQEFRSFCSVSVPNYVGGSDGFPGSSVAARADSGADGDVRLTGCRAATTSTLETAMTLATEGQGANKGLVARLFLVDDSAFGVSGRAIEFFVGGQAVGSATTNDEGVARLVLPARYRGGKHVFEARFSGDDAYTPASARTGGVEAHS